jgi:hypothetical protein
MAKRRRGRARPESNEGDFEQPLDPVVITQGVGNFETINGMPNGILAVILVVITAVLLRPIMRAFRAYVRQ